MKTKTLSGTQTVEVLLELGLVKITRTFDLKGKEREKEELLNIAKRNYSSIVNKGGTVKVITSNFRNAK